MKILITGGTGFVGSHLVNSLVKKKVDITILKRSTTNPWRIKDSVHKIKSYDIDNISLQDILSKERADIIFHLATNQGRKGESIDQIIDSNISFPSKLLDIATKNGLKAFINTDTSAFTDHSIYASTKKAFQSILSNFYINKDLTVVNFELEYVYGPKDDDAKFVPSLVKNILTERSIDASPGIQRRDFIYVQDVANAYIKALEGIKKIHKKKLSFQIGSGESISLKEFAETVARLSTKRAKINWGALDFRKGDILESQADITNARKLLDWSPEHSLEQGLRKTIKWFREPV